MRTRSRQPIRWGLVAMATIWMMVIVPLSAVAAPYAALVMDARSGEVLHARNADTRLHPASLTKMMTLYVVFEAVENGEITLDTPVRISKHAASEPPSKLGLRSGSTIKLRYLIRAAAVKSANDAATALGEAIEGSEAAFARRMNRTAKALGMTRTTFKNAHGLTEEGHLSTARDMSLLGRHLFYDYPEYYNLFSRVTADAGIKKVYHTNRRLLNDYRGADGIKTGYTRAAGFNLTASAERGGERIIATVFGGRSTASRNAKVAELLDLGFREAPTRVAVNRPSKPVYMGKIGPGPADDGHSVPGGVGKTVRLASAAAVKKSLRPQRRPGEAIVAEATSNVGNKEDIEKALLAAAETITEEATPPAAQGSAVPTATPKARPEDLVLASVDPSADTTAKAQEPASDPVQKVVTRISTSGGRHWGINVGRYPSQYKAQKVLLKTALNEMETLDGSLRKVVKRSTGFDANFMGMTRESADLACRRLQAKQITCFMIDPGA
ncbi:D-alanyl-D-alanine carboxypeptidase family protein [Roseovarius atlanticus]|uniref:D-alanyl-D-alanine carboxypeptidase family protein n=1 Tax=Roseovarius atlanticus TaxID=1641875 RepID=UPI001C95E41D|nr:D-alanyl-D-alanine carboxypeptidase family protein [Roseovarius atlanticus]MBY5989768.1 D-alanyl-D-alanine carboxypeptidase [Roseovarius atlanticus]MBY6126313.1 D-alanyl-D-alanine carboxypeptidase [Roseovarius atlanticus]MBY6150807.1 D-alanyl-D-alanine carboxypeptidase [Roseovarius atlanticus]